MIPLTYRIVKNGVGKYRIQWTLASTSDNPDWKFLTEYKTYKSGYNHGTYRYEDVLEFSSFRDAKVKVTRLRELQKQVRLEQDWHVVEREED